MPRFIIHASAVRTGSKGFWTLKEINFFREPCLQSSLQAYLDEINKQENPRASSAPRPDVLLQKFQVVMFSQDLP
jgi:hypothetical protein